MKYSSVNLSDVEKAERILQGMCNSCFVKPQLPGSTECYFCYYSFDFRACGFELSMTYIKRQLELPETLPDEE